MSLQLHKSMRYYLFRDPALENEFNYYLNKQELKRICLK